MSLNTWLAGLADPPLVRALWLSTALHLGLLVLIRPAPWTVPADVVIEARLTPVPATPVQPEAATPLVAPVVASAPAKELPSSSPPVPPTASSHTMPAPSNAVIDETALPERDSKSATTGVARQDEESSIPLPEVSVMHDAHWYTAREVERRPEPLDPIDLIYPEQARQQGITGNVVVALHIDEYGTVRKLEILESQPPGVFDAAVIAAYSPTRFQPAIRAGRPVRYIGKYRVLFELD